MALPANITGSDNNVLSIAASNNKGLLIRFLNEQVEDGFYALVIDYPDIFKCICETDIDKTYKMPKSAVTYRKPRRLTEEQRMEARYRMNRLNELEKEKPKDL